MEQNSRSTALALTILLAVFLQVLFVWLDGRETPNRVAVSFAKAYFKLDASMSRFLCSDLESADDVDVVDNYIHRTVNEAQQQGFDASWAKCMLYDIETHTLSQDPDSASIRLTAKRRKSINPVFTVVAKLFHIGETHTVDETIELTKEDGSWKVCSPAFQLIRS
ncbi:MAG: hypothetical protein LJE65_02090 [Desulfobacteraceae bacterium]|jgi:hypothetical protein|nr:hypothetical protein [Desulfobacteraceae bacterium]